VKQVREWRPWNLLIVLDRVAGRYPITITLRHWHSQTDAIERAFGDDSGGHKIGQMPELPAKSESGREAASDF
jgi:hypothetical protein